MRHLIALGLCLCVVGSAAAQTEVIIRRPGEKDQVIRLDSARTKEALARAQVELRKMTTSVQQHMRTMEKQMQPRLAELPERVNTLAFKTGEMTSLTLAPMIQRLKERLRQPRLGIMVDTRSRDTDKWGAYVTSVTPGSPADKAGILSGDVIMRIAGKSLTEKPGRNEGNDDSSPGIRLINLVSQLEPGKPVEVELRRGTQNRTVKVTPVEDESPSIARLMPDRVPSAGGFAYMLPGRELRLATPEEPVTTMEMPSLNLFSGGGPGSFVYSFSSNGIFANVELVSLNEKLGSYFGTNEGVLVVNTNAHQMFEDAAGMARTMTIRRRVDTARAAPRAGVIVRGRGDSGVSEGAEPAARRAPFNIGLEPGDVIVSVDGRKVTTPSQLMRIVGTYDHGEEFKLQIMRQKRAESLTVKMP